MSREILDASIRAFVSKGTEKMVEDQIVRLIPLGNVIPGLQSAEAPEGLYASVHMINEMPIGRNTGKQYIGESESFTVDGVMIDSTYSLHFYRKGAIEAASLFVDWTRSESGINWASTAITDGRIKGANVYAGGTGYVSGSICTFMPAEGTPSADMPSENATGVVVADDAGRLQRINMRTFGKGYYDMPTASISGETETAKISPRGFGFDIRHPLMIRNLTGMIADDFEERAQLDLRICHTRIYTDKTSGRVEQIIDDST